MTKRCFKCGANKPIDEFYRHAEMADGYLGKCKDCTKAYTVQRRLRLLDSIRARERARGKEPQRIAKLTAFTAKWRRQYPDRAQAHQAVSRALRDERLVRPKKCSRCGSETRVEAHHWDYSRPLVVEWVCKPCHAQADKERREAQSVGV